MKVQVHRVVLMVIDHDRLGAAHVEAVLEHTRYPNHCIAPVAMSVDTCEVDWDDKHPLNQFQTYSKAFEELFK